MEHLLHNDMHKNIHQSFKIQKISTNGRALLSNIQNNKNHSKYFLAIIFKAEEKVTSALENVHALVIAAGGWISSTYITR